MDDMYWNLQKQKAHEIDKEVLKEIFLMGKEGTDKLISLGKGGAVNFEDMSLKPDDWRRVVYTLIYDPDVASSVKDEVGVVLGRLLQERKDEVFRFTGSFFEWIELKKKECIWLRTDKSYGKYRGSNYITVCRGLVGVEGDLDSLSQERFKDLLYTKAYVALSSIYYNEIDLMKQVCEDRDLVMLLHQLTWMPTMGTDFKVVGGRVNVSYAFLSFPKEESR